MTARNRPRTSAIPFVVICIAVWLVPTMIAIGLWSVTELVEKEAVSAAPPAFVDVGQRLDSEARDAVVDVRFGDARSVPIETGGTVTEVHASRGSDLSNGAPVISVNNATVVAYAQDFPLYRPLARGDRGPDVEALQKFLRDSGFLDSPKIDDAYGRQVERAVRGFQRTHGHEIDGIFRPDYVVFVGSSFRVAKLYLATGEKVVAGDELMDGEPAVTRVEITDPELGPLPPFSNASLLLEVGDASVAIDATSLESRAAQELFDGLRDASAGGTMLEDGTALRYADARVSLREPSKWATVPSSAVHVTADGAYCVLEANDDLVQLKDIRESSGQPGVLLVPPELIGKKIFASVADVDSSRFVSCG